MKDSFSCSRADQECGNSPLALALVLTTGVPVRFASPLPETRAIVQAFSPWLTWKEERDDAWVEVRPEPRELPDALIIPEPWTIGDAMALSLVPVLAGTLPRRIHFRGTTHRSDCVGVSHIAEGLLPMMDRRGSRSYMEVETWGNQGQAFLDVRPPLSELAPANLTSRGDVVEIVAWVAVSNAFQSGEEWEENTHRILESAGWLHPEVEVESLRSWSGPPRLLYPG